MRILMTGATGFIGSHLLPVLLRQNHQVWAIVRDQSKRLEKGCEILAGDLRLPLATENFPKTIDAIIHLAQSEHFRNFPDRADDIFYTNVVSTQHLLNYARQAGARQFILASSGGVYGSDERAFNEDDSVGFQDELGFYLGTKLCSEVLANSYETIFNVVTLRFFFVYGARQRPTMLMPRLINSVRAGQHIRLQGNDGIKINPTYITDAVAAINAALRLNVNSKINIGGAETVYLRELGEKIGNIVGRKPIFEIDRTTVPRHLVGDIDKMLRLLCAPQTNLAQGLLKTIQGEKYNAV